ncbi:MAG: secondary thiamine-phosphate synthase enzyme YjbQ [candidate division KSB1 bacterium]|nr:secondary thiamine-phosphate synthase enzyme YjbQ [candidate division KSB1 bacterium]MDZ7273099.1 secondary thiamine-phosphate synthase enzyme YjbQ [candidate division KSB1 bacterium]MDZ7285201.1 secondary thiamine-phosphate synthase enzyme YjbQ [candidate division KSB1 bacterium]MDZ7298233.1 secondary thiamine-phosphate synthase enzyme YjbQ [candidate division KSB1 bacterium]MDZ7306735.1 secondary thiamine-phosphate synthase enzyme YjbQ [candidate division KSB1 bacterium]
MRQVSHILTLPTTGKGLYEFTREVRRWLAEMRAATGLLTVFVQHTSASLLIQENADPEVQRDLERFFRRLVPEGDALFHHRAEGPDDMPAHVRAALTATSLGIPVQNGEPVLGTWQGIYLYEHRNTPHRRRIVLHFIGD